MDQFFSICFFFLSGVESQFGWFIFQQRGFRSVFILYTSLTKQIKSTIKVTRTKANHLCSLAALIQGKEYIIQH